MKTKNLKLKTQSGFSLTEVIVVTALSMLVFMGIFNFGQRIFSFNSSAQKNLSAQSGARRVLKTIVKELRSASPSSLGAYAISQVGTSSVTFFSNVDNDALKEQVRYFLQSNELKRGIIKPTGNPLTYNPANEQVISLIKDVRNSTSTPIFEYYNASYTGTSSALVQPVQPTQVRLVKIVVKIEKDPNKSIGPFQVESQVFLRNLKDNL